MTTEGTARTAVFLLSVQSFPISFSSSIPGKATPVSRQITNGNFTSPKISGDLNLDRDEIVKQIIYRKIDEIFENRK
jgi:hypothetical protein